MWVSFWAATTAHRRAGEKAQIGRYQGQDARAEETDQASKKGQRRTANHGEIVDGAFGVGGVNHRIFEVKKPVGQQREATGQKDECITPKQVGDIEKKDAADQADNMGVAIEPAQDIGGGAKGRTGDDKGYPQPQAVNRQQNRSLIHFAAVTRNEKYAGENGADTRNPACAKAHAQQHTAEKDPALGLLDAFR